MGVPQLWDPWGDSSLKRVRGIKDIAPGGLLKGLETGDFQVFNPMSLLGRWEEWHPIWLQSVWFFSREGEFTLARNGGSEDIAFSNSDSSHLYIFGPGGFYFSTEWAIPGCVDIPFFREI